MLRIANHTAHLALLTALLGLAPGCGDPVVEAGGSEGSESESGDPSESDASESGSESDTNDSDPSGDGDGDDPATDTDSGDGDGDDPGTDTDPTDTGDGDGDDPTTDTDDPTATGDGDGDDPTTDTDDPTATGDGDGDPPPDSCGDGIVDEFEECDDQNLNSEDGCLADCTIPRSCLQIIQVDPEAGDGSYMLSPEGGDNELWETQCDMSTDGGGWTQIEVQDTCTVLSSDIVAIDAADNFDVNGECMPSTRDGLQAHTYTWDISFPPQYSAFYMQGYSAEANTGGFGNATSEINGNQFEQGSWDTAHGNDHGDISFGDPNDAPIISFAAAGANEACYQCQLEFPMNDVIFELAGPTNELRIGWGEEGIELEGWRPWTSGSIYVR